MSEARFAHSEQFLRLPDTFTASNGALVKVFGNAQNRIGEGPIKLGEFAEVTLDGELLTKRNRRDVRDAAIEEYVNHIRSLRREENEWINNYLTEKYGEDWDDINSDSYALKEEGENKRFRVEEVASNFTLTQDNTGDFEYAIMNSISDAYSARGDYKQVKDVVVRVKDHTPNWSNFLRYDEATDEYVPVSDKILNVTIGDYNNTDYRKVKEGFDEFVAEYPDVKAVNVEVEDGTSVADALEQIHTALKEKGIDFEFASNPYWVNLYSAENNDLSASRTRFSVKDGDKKTSISERSDAISDNSSSNGLLRGGKEHLSHVALTTPEDVAKLQQNSQNTIRSARKQLNAGGFNNLTTPENAVRELGGKLKLKKAKSSQSYYGEFYEGDFLVGGRKLNLRVSTHPANGYRMGNSDADDKVSIVIYKNGEHYSNGEHAGYVEYTYDEKDVSLNDAANAVLKGVINLIENGEYIDETQKAKFQEYPYVDENGNTRFRVAEEDVEADDYEAIEGGVRFKIVDDEEVIKKFATEPLVKTYRAMVKIGDKYYPPMSTKEDGKLREGNALGDIVQSEERPDLAIEEDGKWYFKLEKDNDDDLEARYNPYLHTSDWMMNDQFKQAGDRPNLVVVEMGLLPSDLESGYHAEKAKDSTGWVAGGWKAGDVANQLPIKRQVALTQYGKMLREVPTQEVAEHIYTFEDWTDSNGVTHEGTNAGTWGGDAYSPRYPSVEYVFDRKVRDAF